MVKTMDLNSDLGEGFGQWSMGDDALMLSVVSSANVACGFHAGHPAGILNTLKKAAAAGVVVGAHISYPDLVGFGRRNMEIASHELTADVIYQIGALQGMAKAAGTVVQYVKPHGALYNTIAVDDRQAQAVIDGLKAIDSSLPLVGLAGSRILRLAHSQGLHTIAEAFADRAYQRDGSLAPRHMAGSVLHDAQRVARRVLQLINEGGLMSVDGEFIPLQADSVCVHGDTPGAVDMARQVRALLESSGIVIAPFI